MAVDATRLQSAALRPSLTVVRGRKPDRRTEIEDLRMEVTAAGLDMQSMASRITNALTVGDMHTAMQFAGRLYVLGGLYADPEDEAA